MEEEKEWERKREREAMRFRDESKCREVVKKKKTGREIEEDKRIGFKMLHFPSQIEADFRWTFEKQKCGLEEVETRGLGLGNFDRLGLMLGNKCVPLNAAGPPTEQQPKQRCLCWGLLLPQKPLSGWRSARNL